ncbi:tail tube [Synechococcus phage S-SCSM1]|uniref:Tail tube protein n=1 Tax=Synechococcus phage S-SCSM1 TaxID=2588487 RepID=A0A6M2ZHB0_9CAUD|nr:tail tube [Synechococcus phage S-SCSM1]QFG06291.1 tail tube protein [Synechococcus phage S-SCSM1]
MANNPTLKNLSSFKTRLAGGGARPNIFEVQLDNFPGEISSVWGSEEKVDFRFFCKTAQLPASNVAPIEIPFRGRTLKVAGDRTFDTWTVTIINDEDFKLRHAFEAWMNLLSKLDNATGAANPASYMVDATVHQLGRSDKVQGTKVRNNVNTQGPGFGASGDGSSTVLRTYNFKDIFPTNVSAIDLSYDTTDTIEEFTVEFQVQYFEMTGGPGTLK